MTRNQTLGPISPFFIVADVLADHCGEIDTEERIGDYPLIRRFGPLQKP